MKRLIILGALLLGLAACAEKPGEESRPDMGNFRLGHNVVVVNDPEIGPFSREASNEELKTALESAIQERFGPYEGDKYYHIGTKLDLYALALPGVPLVFSPKSVFVVTVSIWDDATQTLLTPEGGKDFTVFESISGQTLISSGLTQTKEEQIQNLARNTAKAIQDYILEHPEWIGLPPRPEAESATK